MVNLEKEIKYIIDRNKFEDILLNNSIKSFYEQNNFYFDTPNLLLYKSGITFRIRKVNNEIILTLKHNINDTLIKDLDIEQNYYLFSNEYECILTNDHFASILSNPINLIMYIGQDGLKILSHFCTPEHIKLVGMFLNNRFVLENKEGYSFELDQSILPNNNINYELEFEGISPEQFLSIKKDLNLIDMKLNFLSKYKRFINFLLIDVSDS